MLSARSAHCLHPILRCFDFLKGTREVPGGLEVFDIPAGTLPDQLGMRPGDILVSLAGAGVFGLPQVHFATRSHAPGTTVEAKWIRDGKVLSGTGQFTNIVAMRRNTP